MIRTLSRPLVAATSTFVWLALAAGLANGPKFYRDDPISRDPETQDASKVPTTELSQLYDFAENSFLGAGEKVNKPALNVNTIDEVPDSSWFTNRIGREPWPADRVAKGPDTGNGPSGRWTIVSGKMEGRAPGFTIRDDTGQLYFIKFDPPSNPEMASAAEVISTKFFHAFGYFVPENYIATIARDSLVIGEGALVEDQKGRKRQMDTRDLDGLLKGAAGNADGSFRTLASKALEGKPVGPFRYYGTRPDDPNDIFPHEHRRELRGLLAFCAWLNHDDSRSINTLDTLVNSGGKTIVRHNLLDFGSTLGSGTLQAQSTRPEDLFWAARILSSLSEDAVREVVKTGQYSDPRATTYLTETLLTRRTKVLKAWLNATNPIVNAVLTPAGDLAFENASQKAAVGPAAERYTIQWSQFDNAASTHKDVGAEQTVTDTRAQPPAELLAARPEYLAARVRAFHRDFPTWSQPVMLYFRRAGDAWALVGLERNP
jgi:hypothetical protein